MTDPVAPQIPEDAPPDVKRFFACTGLTMTWQKGTVTWLGLPVNPDVSFGPGKAADSVEISITVGSPPFGTSFSVPASVNANGELVVDTSAVPDLSALGLGGPADVQRSIDNINAWFKKNGYKLKKPKLIGGEVKLEKIAIGTPPPAPATAKVPPTTPKPKPADEPKTAPVPPAKPETKKETTETQESSGSGCAKYLGLILVFLFFGVIALGAGIGFAFFGGPTAATPPPTTVAAASPSRAPVATRATPAATRATAAPSTPATVGPPSTPARTPTPAPTPTTAPALPSPTPTILNSLSGFCARVVHQQFGPFISYLDWFMYWYGFDVDHFLLTVGNANGGEPVTMAFDPADGSWRARIGLMNAGPKPILELVAVLDDGTPIDVTEELVRLLSGDLTLNVRFPQEDSFGTICPN